MLTDRRRTDDGVTGILIAHLGAFCSGELKTKNVFCLKKFGWISLIEQKIWRCKEWHVI